VIAGENAVALGFAAEFVQMIGVPFPAIGSFALARQRLADSAFEAEGMCRFNGFCVVVVKVGPGEMAILATEASRVEGLADLFAGFRRDLRQPHVIDQLITEAGDGAASGVEIFGESGVDIVALKAEWEIQGKCV